MIMSLCGKFGSVIVGPLKSFYELTSQKDVLVFLKAIIEHVQIVSIYFAIFLKMHFFTCLLIQLNIANVCMCV